MSFDPFEYSNIIVSAAIKNNLADQEVSVQIVPTPSEDPALIIRIEAPPIPQYGRETSMYGKSLRLLYNLQKSSNLMKLLKEHDIKHVGVTESMNPALCNPYNTTTFDIKTLATIFDSLSSMSSGQGDEYIGHVIRMSTTKQ